jgi:hypothetical protein
MERHETADLVRYDLHDLTAGVSTMEEVWSYLSGYTGIGAFYSCSPPNQHAWHGMAWLSVSQISGAVGNIPVLSMSTAPDITMHVSELHRRSWSFSCNTEKGRTFSRIVLLDSEE